MRKIISFDMDGTLFDEVFDRLLWDDELPRLYAERHKVSLENARKKCIAEYKKEGKFSLKWYDAEYWFSLFDIKDGWKKVIKGIKHKVHIYDDTIPSLKVLSKKYDLIVLSTAMAEFIELKLSVENIRKYFKKIYSSTSDLGAPGKDKMVFRKLLKVLNIKPENLIHVGDDYDFDYKIPRKMGVQAYFLDRTGKKKGEFVIHSLKELEEKLL